MKGVFVSVVLVLLLTGCGPKYELVNQRKSPIGDPIAAECMQQCRTKNDSCARSCSSEKNACLTEQKERAANDWPAKSELFAAETQTYYAEKALYDQESRRISAEQKSLTRTFNDYKYKCKTSVFNRATYCSRAETTRLQLLALLSEGSDEPKKPKKKSLSGLTKEYQKLCDQPCGCEESFEICFQSCGGTIETKRICVSGCE